VIGIPTIWRRRAAPLGWRAALGAVLSGLVCTATPAQDPATDAPAEAHTNEVDLGTAAAARAGVDRAVGFLLQHQNDEGSWGTSSCDTLSEMSYSVETHHAWNVAAHALATMALREAPETPARREALDKAVRWLCECRMPLRSTDWDNDAMWSSLYGAVACADLARDARFGAAPWSDPIARRGRAFVRWLEQNQEPLGGFGYYDDPPYSRRPNWGTSFATASVLPTLAAAIDLGWLTESGVRDRAARYVRRCRLPNGAYEYDLNPMPRAPKGEHINNVKGSLGRIQVCNWALRRAGDPGITDDFIRRGLRQFFEHHRFLSVARMRPIPHEAYYANAGYFFYFGHYYCGLAIEELPVAERDPFRSRLRVKILETQRANGSFGDFLSARYSITAATAFATLGLQAGLEQERPTEGSR